MKAAFWDTSVVVPICLQQHLSSAVRQLAEQHAMVVWWGTPVEARSAFERLRRMGQITEEERSLAYTRLQRLRRGWREVQPSDALRSRADDLLAAHPLKAADALQLAAAWVWCSGSPAGSLSLTADAQLRQAARDVGFDLAP